jgi:hypothetical protein
MTTTDTEHPGGDQPEHPGPKFEINIEGTLHAWDHDTITVAQLRHLGGLPADVPVVEVNLETNTERTLAENEIVDLKPGQGFGRKVRFQRG